MNSQQYSSSAAWLRPTEETAGLKRYVETVRERWLLILGAILVTTLIAVLYVLTATKTYEATADMLVTPVNSSDPVLTSLGLLRESADPTRDVQTASQLITNLDVARRVEKKLDNGESAEALLAAVSAEPVANSNFVAVIASESSPELAQEVANAFAQATVEERTQTLHTEIEERLPRLEAIETSGGETAQAGEVTLAAQIAELQALAAGPDPTMRVQTEAALPSSPSSPKKALSIFAGLLAGLVLGLAGAFALQVLDPRVRRESQLRRLYRLPVLTRVPRVRGHSGQPLTPGGTSLMVDEAYRTLRGTLARASGREGGEGRLILVTGSSAEEGKTTSAASLATSLALLGRRVILIEADLRRPSLGKLFGVQPETGVVNVLTGQARLEQSLVQTQTYGSNLQLLLAERDLRGGWVTELFATFGAQNMISEARRLADYVVVDSPPLNEVVDGLPLAVAADDVLLVVRLGRARLDKLRELGELLAENEISPAGFVLVGVRPTGQDNHYANGPLTRQGQDSTPSGEPAHRR